MYIAVFITAGNKAEAKKIARALIGKKLAACVNIIGGIESIFRWGGKIDSGKESLLVVKTKKSRFAALVKAVQSVHSYELPEMIAMPIVAGEKKYLEWIDDSLSSR